ncbi:MAG: RNA polymerase [Clostridia bacterium]|nr:RNA polymerase [Clostridia bacterium]
MSDDKQRYLPNDRDDCLRSLADGYGVPEEAVQALADILEPDEDFDSLVSSLEDAADDGWFRDGTDDDD